MKKDEKNKLAILNSILEHAAFDGWYESTLEKAAKDVGLNIDDALVLFPGGISDVIKYFSVWSDEEMLKILRKKDLESMKIRERIATSVMVRLEIHSKHKEAMRKLAAFYTLPQNNYRAARKLARMVNIIWYEAGDKSTDFNYYTKRGLLAGVFISTFLYWLNDDSKNHIQTEKFLHRRISDVMNIQKIRGKAEEFLGNIPFLRKLRS